MPFRHRLVLVAGLLALLLPATSQAEEYYFVTVYGAQRPVINQGRYTHTWATALRLTGTGPDLRTYCVEGFTISWLSADLRVDPKKLAPQPGRNLTHEETLRWCDENKMAIAQFGPYQVQPELYRLLAIRRQKLESGHVYYRAADILNLGRRIDEVCNCIYAVLDFDGRDPALRPVTLGFGFKASAFVARRLHPWTINPDLTYPWVNDMIGVKNFPTVRVGLAALLLNFPDGEGSATEPYAAPR